MFQVVPQWTVTVSFDVSPKVIFHVHDHFISNVLRKIADLEFPGATSIRIEPRILPNLQQLNDPNQDAKVLSSIHVRRENQR